MLCMYNETFFCSFFFFFFKGTCGIFLEHGVGFFIFLFYRNMGSFGCVHGEVRSFIEYGVVL